MELIIKTSRETADATIPKEYQEEIIRCRHCKLSGWNYLEDETKDYCFKHVTQDGDMLQIKQNDFCAWAEKVD